MVPRLYTFLVYDCGFYYGGIMEDVKKIKDEGLMKISEIKSLEEVEEFRIAYLSKKGLVQGLMMQIKDLPKE